MNFSCRITLLPDCQMNFCNFPHDTQRCSLYISSIAHPKSMLDFHWEPRPILFPRRVSLPDLRIKKIADTICQLPGKLIPSSCLALTFVLKRDSARYVAERYMPSILAMLFSWVAPYVPYNYEEVRIITPITVLLTLVQMEKGNQEVITSYLTSLDIWFVVIKAFTVLSLVESLAVMAYIKKGRAVESEAQRAPNEYRRELLQAEVKRIERLYHRLDHLSMALSPLAFILFMLYYVHFVAQRDGRSCVERHAEDGRMPL
uniref:Neurotransmitter-gated ion-channel ligand-binding domain-containing protein n=1 Tax=Globodera rostochiensis TaxID=31243 RepID=A0A914I6C1_GLORO